MMFHTLQKLIPKYHLSTCISNFNINIVDSFNFLRSVKDAHLKRTFHFRDLTIKETEINWILRKLKYIILLEYVCNCHRKLNDLQLFCKISYQLKITIEFLN